MAFSANVSIHQLHAVYDRLMAVRPAIAMITIEPHGDEVTVTVTTSVGSQVDVIEILSQYNEQAA